MKINNITPSIISAFHFFHLDLPHAAEFDHSLRVNFVNLLRPIQGVLMGLSPV